MIPLRRWVILFLLFLFSTGTIVSEKDTTLAQIVSPPSTSIPASLFGMHIHHAATTTPWPTVPFATWRLWDAGVSWPNLEPRRGEWHFETLDKYLVLAEQHQVEILLTLGQSPPWASARPTDPSPYGRGWAAEPKNIEDWRNYVRTVATRYKGRIRYYEIWNEPNLQNFYSGTVEQMVTLSHEAFSAIEDVDPSITVVSPPAYGGDKGLSWLEEYFRRGGGASADVIGHHFYETPNPEAILPLVRKVQQMMAKYGVSNKPLWNTEKGWAIASRASVEPTRMGFSKNTSVLPPDEAAAYVARSFVLGWAAGLKRFYWYAWDNQVMGLTEVDGTLKLAATAYAETQKWLVGARMTGCESNSEKTWTCQLSRDRGYTAWIVWNPERQLTFAVPKTWSVQQVRDLTGVRFVPKLARLDVGPSPLLLERPAL